jgi:hypothetical protein
MYELGSRYALEKIANKALVPFKGKAGSAAKETGSSMMNKLRDFFGNPEMDIPYKYEAKGLGLNEKGQEIARRIMVDEKMGRPPTFDDIIQLRRNRSMDVTGAGAPEVRAQLEKDFLKAVQQGKVEVPGGVMGPSYADSKDLVSDFMKLDRKNPNFNDMIDMQTNPEKDTFNRLVGGQLYGDTMDTIINKMRNQKSPLDKEAPIVRDIASKGLSKKDMRKYHPDLMTHNKEISPEQKAQIEDAIKRGVLNLKGMNAPKDSGLKIQNPRDTKDRVWARKVLDMFDNEYARHSSAQRAMPGSKARDYNPKIDKLEPWMRRARYARNAGLVGAPVAGAGYGGYQLAEGD